jgi:gliding motility-associated-like protein
MTLTIIGKRILIAFLLILGFARANASHILGGEIFYTYVSGTTYRVSMILYGDCSGVATTFAALSTATPEVQIYNGTALITTLYLQPQLGSGVNVSPVCPDEINNTNCTPNGTLPGVKKFIYATNYTLNTTSANWKFRFTGMLISGNTQAGRSNAITNAVITTAGSLMSLEATLNNAVVPTNSSPTYTTIPTPFFCINKPQEYNQGAIDSDADSLRFTLIPGLEASGNTSTNIPYISPFTATAPLGCTPGTFIFNGANGQLSFTPNIIQKALVVSRVTEYRNGVIVGTSMREMTFVVLNNCNNNPPTGPVGNVSNGTLDNSTTVKVCKFNGTVSFNIQAADPDNDNVTITTQGLPANAVTSISNNGTPSPVFSFSWNVTNVNPGTYVFYLTYTDDGCPLISKQTVAYTIKVLEKPSFLFNLISAATCTQKAKFTITPLGTDVPYALQVLQGTTSVLSLTNITGPRTDSVPSGSYTFNLIGANGCNKDTFIDLGFVSLLTPIVSWTQPFCPGSGTGTITMNGTGSFPPFQYAMGTSAYSTTNTFTGLNAGAYLMHIKDSLGCIKDTSITITNPLGMVLTVGIKKPVCSPVANGQLTISVANGTAPYQYALNAGAFSTSNTFNALATGTHIIHVKDVNNCLKDTTITLLDSLQMVLQPIITPILCFGNTNGAITINASGATAPYSYAFGTGTFALTNTFSGLSQGTYAIHARDANGCLKDTSIALVQPSLLGLTLSRTNVLCFGNNTGAIVVSATGGTPAYQYAVNSGAFQTSNSLSNLTAGTYTVHLKDAGNCVKDTIVTITQPATAITFGAFNINSPTCEGFTDGSIVASAQGGVAPYQFSINGGAFGTATTLANLAEGNHVVKARDNNGCEKDTVITLTGFPHIVLDGVDMKLPSCNGNSDGSLTLNVSGGLPPFTYQLSSTGSWSNSSIFNDKISGQYLLRVKDANGCMKDTSVFLSQPDKIIVDTASVGNDCNGVDNGGVINVSVKGGTAPFQYIWSHDPNLNSAKIAGLVNGVYSVKVVDANGCTGNATVEILYNNCCTPFIPNAFTPNGDGANDNYRVEYKGDMDLKEMYIYNRYGQRVFSSSNVSKTWDGTFNDKKVDAGTYFYYIRILCGNVLKKELIFKGDLTLIR